MRSFSEIAAETGTDKHWAHSYDRFYDAHFSPLRDQRLTLLEIGVLRGASLRLWNEFFPKAAIYGIDHDPGCKLETGYTVFIGNQADPIFLGRVADEMGWLDIVIDDGGHSMDQQLTSFQMLFPRLRAGGWYVIEDLDSSYGEVPYGGGAIGKPGTTIALLKDMIDDLHYCIHHLLPLNAPAQVSEMHLYPKIAFLRKA